MIELSRITSALLAAASQLKAKGFACDFVNCALCEGDIRERDG